MGETSNYLSDKVRSAVRKHSYSSSNEPTAGTTTGPILPITEPRVHSNPGSLKHSDGRVSPNTGLAGFEKEAGSHVSNGTSITGEPSPHNVAWATGGEIHNVTTTDTSSRAASADKSKAESPRNSAIENGQTIATKPPLNKRAIAGCKRFVLHVKNAVCSSYINVLLVFVPIGIAAEAAHLSPTLIFALNAVAIVPLAGLLAHATETVATHLGSNIGALLNITFGNAVELIIFIIALAKGEISIVQASLIGSILSNLLLILGMAFLLGGLRFREQVYNNTVTQMSACLLTLSVGSLVLPTAFHASFNQENATDANTRILEVSRGTSVILLLVYILYLLFQLKSHSYLYESTPQHVIDEESHPGVLADMLNNSSSSSSDSDSDSSSSDSSASHGTAGKRLRRLIRNRRRRKSSASTSTAGTVSMPSVHSPSMEHRESFLDNRSQQTSRPVSPLGVIVSGDEADADAEDERGSAPRIRDFVSLDSDAFRSVSGRKKHRRRHKNKQRKHRQRDEEKAGLAKEAEVQAEPAVTFTEPAETPAAGAEQAMPKRPFIMRGLSSKANIHPGLSKMLSNNVFVTPQPSPSNPIPRLRSEGALRRTNSLPDRLNKPSQQPSEDFHLAINGTLPPYTVRRVTTPRAGLDVGEDKLVIEKLPMSRTAAIVMLIVSTALVAVCAEFMVDAIPQMISNSPVSEAFIGLIILPIVGNAAEHVTAITVAVKNKMDLAIAVAVGSSIQIALFVTPIVVLLGWIMHAEMSLYFNIFQTVSLFIAVLVVNFLCLDGRSNYLEGALLIAAYVIIALVAFYYPQTDAQSALGGGYSS